jgi:hypothetical protein
LCSSCFTSATVASLSNPETMYEPCRDLTVSSISSADHAVNFTYFWRGPLDKMPERRSS